jgi:O-succinylbenzoate synthase
VLRSFAAKSALSIAAGTGILLGASATLPAAAAHAAVTARPNIAELVFTEHTYPNTAAGLSACMAEGQYIVSHSDGEDTDPVCILGDPDAGVLNLWVHIQVP